MSEANGTRRTGVLPKLAAVLHGLVSTLFEFERRIGGQILAGEFTMRLGPARLAWIPFLLEGAMATRSTESKDLRSSALPPDTG